jgi:hypothetical protein
LFKQRGEITVSATSEKSNVKEVLMSEIDANLCLRRNLNEEYKGAPALEVFGAISCIDIFLSTSRMIHLLPLISMVSLQHQIIQDVPVEKKDKRSNPNEPPSKYSDVALYVQAIKLNLEKEYTGMKREVEPLATFGFERIEMRIAEMTDSAVDLELLIPHISTKDKRLDSSNVFRKPLRTNELFMTMSTNPKNDTTSMAITLPDLVVEVVFDFWLDVYDVMSLPIIRCAYFSFFLICFSSISHVNNS